MQIRDKKITDEGYILFEDVVFSRSGVQEYYAYELGMPPGLDNDPLQVVRVYRPIEEVTSKESIDSIRLKPVTNDHPSSFVDMENYKAVQVGTAGEEIIIRDNHLVGKIILNDKKAIEDYALGKREISLGYSAEYEFVSGETSEGETYDAIQRNIRVNHVALVDKGRCGGTCRVVDTNPETKRGDSMDPVLKINGVDCKLGDTQSLQIVEAHIGALNDTIAELNSKIETLTATVDGKQAELDDLRGKVLDDAAINSLIQKRTAFENRAKSLVADYDPSGKSDEQVMRDVLEKRYPSRDFSDKTAVYLQAAFDLLDSSGDSLGNDVRDAFDSAPKEIKNSVTLAASARQKAIDSQNERWR